MLLFCAATMDRWTPGIGDPTPLGWLIVVAYAIAVGLAWAAFRAVPADASRRLRGFWLAMGLILLALGVNKQLDLQSWLTQFGRDLSQAQGWYLQRRKVQFAFIVALVVSGLGGLGAVWWWLRGELRQVRAALAGLLLLICFIIVRAASMHHVDYLLGETFFGRCLNAGLELSGIIAVALAAWSFRNRFRRPRSAEKRNPAAVAGSQHSV